MKKLIALAGMAVTVLVLAVCCTKPSDKPEGKTLEINETTLAGTWEGGLEHDMAQGYAQKYRITFSGKKYTLWHQHQRVDMVDGEWTDLINVGNKESGTWEYANGTLSLKASKQYASYFISNMSPLEYTYYDYNVDTMEADPWYESPDWVVEMAEVTQWGISLTEKALTAKINMDTFVLNKK